MLETILIAAAAFVLGALASYVLVQVVILYIVARQLGF